MKKLLLLLLLSSSFSAYAFQPIEAAPCESGDLNEAVEKLRMELFDENEETSEEDEASLISFLEDMAQDFDVRFGLYKCMESPQGQMVNGVRNGVWTWYNKFNLKTKEGNYVNGKKEGEWIEWIYSANSYHSGNDLILMNYKNDILDGKWTHLYYNGTFENWDAQNEKILLEDLLLKYTLENNLKSMNRINAKLKALENPKVVEERNYINGNKVN